MSALTTTQQTQALNPATIEKVLLGGDLRALKPEERLNYYNSLCESVGFNPLTRPLDYLDLNGKLVLYTNKGGAEQLRQIRKVSLRVTAREKIGDVYVVTSCAKLPDGREDESTGAVPVQGLSGERLANAYMKAETKAKRRVTLSICGMNMLDESEIDSIEGARRVSHEEVATMPAVAYVDRAAATQNENHSKTKWPFKYPENLPAFVEDFATDELLAAEKQLSTWKFKSEKGEVKFKFPQHGDFFIELLRDLMKKPRGERYAPEAEMDNELDRALSQEKF